MSKTFRLPIFLLFLLAFLITAPLVVLYTAGYRLDLSHGRIVHTAVLNISSVPRGANVLIDGEAYSDKTPSVIDTILPGEHLVSLEKDGYISWSKDISFDSREALVMGPVVLFLDDEAEVVEEISAISYSIEPNGAGLAYVSQESSWLEVWLQLKEDDGKKLLMRLPYDRMSNYSLDWSTDGQYLVLESAHGSLSELRIARADDGAVIEFDEPLSDVQEYWWNVEEDHELFARIDDELRLFSLSSDESTGIAFSAERMISRDQQDIVLTKSNNRVALSFQTGETASIITYLPLGDYEFVNGPDGLISLYESQHERLILIDTDNRDQPILLNEDVVYWEWNSANNRLVYTSGFDIKIYDRDEHQSRTLTRLSYPITKLGWYPEGSVVLYQSDGFTTALNLENNAVLSQEVLAEKLHAEYWLNEEADTMYFLMDTSGDLLVWWERKLQE
jgi:hypothetical protein